MTNHANEARKLLKRVPRLKSIDASVAQTHVAQVHATLALAEQQRATNLILLLTSHARSVAEGTLDPDGYMTAFNLLDPEIVSALGLTENS